MSAPVDWPRGCFWRGGMKTYLTSTYLSVSVLALAATASSCTTHDDERSPERGDNIEATTTIDLREFRDHGNTILQAHLGETAGLLDIWFLDGAGRPNSPPAIDLARLLLVADSDALPLPGIRAAYYVGLRGDDGLRYVSISSDEQRITYYGQPGLAVLSDAAHGEAEQQFLAALRADFPDAELDLLESVGLLTFSSESDFVALLQRVASSELVEELELEAELLGPISWGEPVALGSGTRSEIVELYDVATVSRELRAAGTAFTTEPSLPAPFGPGPIPGR
jgi:hypothetical protein